MGSSDGRTSPPLDPARGSQLLLPLIDGQLACLAGHACALSRLTTLPRTGQKHKIAKDLPGAIHTFL